MQNNMLQVIGHPGDVRISRYAKGLGAAYAELAGCALALGSGHAGNGGCTA